MKAFIFPILCIIGVYPVIIYSQTAIDTPNVKVVRSDSLNRNHDTADILSDSSAMIKAISVSRTESAVTRNADTTSKVVKDTIDASIIVKKLSMIRSSFTSTLSKSRAQGYGGGIVLSPMIIGLQMKPVNELAHNDYILKKYTFSELNDSYKPILTLGAIAFGGVGKGLRIGLAGWSGEFSFNSEPLYDSVMILKVKYTFGGLLIEKAFVKNNFNYLVGGMIGFGDISVTKSASDNAWVKVKDYNDEKAESPFAGLSMHSGFTVTLLPWMHIGLDGNAIFSFSVNGFNIRGCSGFSSITPGMRVRIVLGNLG